MNSRDDHSVVLIPARWASTRFPGKVLACETGKPMIQHVYERARLARGVSRVVVATDDERIADAVSGFGGEFVMTSADHPNGTSRLAEAAGLLGLSDDELVINVQADEPEIEPEIIVAVGEALRSAGAPMATVASPFGKGEDPVNLNIVKVVRDVAGCALYFSRSLIPSGGHGSSEANCLKHIGIYAYRVGFLKEYAELVATPLERTERLEQLRALEHGFRIAVAVHTTHHHGIDTPEQYAAFVRRNESCQRS